LGTVLGRDSFTIDLKKKQEWKLVGLVGRFEEPLASVKLF